MEKLKNIPSLRFPEFEGEWEVKKLGEVCDIIGGGTPETNKEEYWNGKINWFTPTEIKSNYVSKSIRTISKLGLQKSSAKILPIGTILLTTRATIGEVSIALEECTTNQGFQSLVTKSNNNIFIFNWIKENKHELISRANGSTFPEISKTEIEKIQIQIPKLPEQTKIASFLTAVDDKLQALKQKKTLLEQYKKGVMQKIFLQELRFKDANGNDYPDWEEKKLGEVFYSEKGKGISKNKVAVDGNFECVLYGELYTKYNEVIYNVVSKTNEIDGIKSKVGDLLIPSSTTTTGIDLANVTALNKDDVLLGGDITVLRTNNEINNVFYAYYLSNYKKEEIASYAQGSTIVHLYYSHIKDMEIHLLSLSEQTKIANFLSAIDDKINHCQAQIEKMEVWKKGLLQQMFC